MGEEVAVLARRFPKGRVVGIDLNPVVIERAQRSYPDCEFHCASAPPDGMRFDAILAMAVLRFGHDGRLMEGATESAGLFRKRKGSLGPSR